MFRMLMCLIIPLSGLLAGPRMIPHITRADGGFETHITMTNLATGPRTYQLTGYDQSGLATMVVSGTLAVGQILQQERASLFNGFPLSHLAVDGNDIQAGVSYRSTAASGTPAEVFETATASTHLRLFPANVNHAWDGVAVVNLGDQRQDIEIVQYDDQGSVVHRTVPGGFQSLAPNAKGLYVFDSDFAPVAQGWFEILAAQPIAVTALRGTRNGQALWQTQAVDLQTVDFGKPVTLERQAVTFTPDSGQAVAAEMGTFQVLENRDNPASRRIPIRFVRLPATTSQPGPPIVYLAGGPGGSAVDAASGVRFETFNRMRAVADVILFEQRGTGLSNSIPVYEERYQTPTDRALSEAVFGETVAAYVARARAVWEGEGADLSGYTSVQSAHDLDALRRALGVEKLTLWGISYGTHLAMATARLYPDRIHRLILAGTEGPDDTLKLPGDADTVLDRLHTLVTADPQAAQRFPDFRAALRGALSNLATSPVSIQAVNPNSGLSETLTLGPYDLQLLIAGALSERATIRLIPQVVEAAAAGRYDLLGGYVQQARNGTIHAMGYATDVAASASVTRRTRVNREAAWSLLGNAPNGWTQQAMENPIVPALPFTMRTALQSEIPTLFIGGTLDGRTPLSRQYALAEGFSQARHLVIENGGHGDDLISSDPDIATTMIDFLNGGPAEDQQISLPPLDFLSPPSKTAFNH